MFPDSRITDHYSCASTKTRSIITHALVPTVNADVVQPAYYVMGGMIRSTSALCSAIGMTVVEKLSLVFLQCLCAIFPLVKQTPFDALATVLSERGIPWSNVIGFCSNSASVMVGRHNSVLSRVLNKQPDVFGLGCICYLAALCAAAGLKALPVLIDNLLIDNLLIDIFYHFKHSSKRVHEFEEILKT